MQSVTKSSQPARRSCGSSRRLRLGFVPLTDCAPLVAAQELGLFARQGLDVVLSRELGWATVRDKLTFGELHAAHALGPMVLQLALGLSGNPCSCFTPLVLNAQGNAITLSRRLIAAGVRDAASLGQWREQLRRPEPLTFGIVFPFSFHHFLLRDWLVAAGLQVERDVKLVIVPPPQMVANLKAGHLDGFCAGEPWGTLAEETETGGSVARSVTLAPLHPEKVLLVRQDLLDQRAEECCALTAALLAACAWCADAANTGALATMLAQPRYVGADRGVIQASLTAATRDGARHLRFHGGDVNEPTPAKAGNLARRLRQCGLLNQPLRPAQLDALFRADLFQIANQDNPNIARHETQSEPQLACATN